MQNKITAVQLTLPPAFLFIYLFILPLCAYASADTLVVGAGNLDECLEVESHLSTF